MGNLPFYLLTLACAFAVGSICLRLKLPGGMLVGSIIGAAALNITFGIAAVPSQSKLIAQIAAGAFIGCSIRREDLKRLKYIYKAALILISMYLTFNLTLGFVLYFTTPLDAATAFFSAVPGGISDIPLIAADMGASAPKVAVMQFVRLIVGIGIFPGMIQAVNSTPAGCSPEKGSESPPFVEKGNTLTGSFPTTALVAFAAGAAGAALKLPAGALVCSMAATAILKLTHGLAYVPMQAKRAAQVLSGSYIGSLIGMPDLLELRQLLFPALLLVLGYSANCFLSGYLLERFCRMDRKEGMLAAIPAGASDIALISGDLGVQSADLVVLHIIRLVTVSSLFPQVIHFLLKLFEKG